MQGSIRQALALTVTGNAFLQGLEIGAFWPDGDAFSFCREVRFMQEAPGATSTVAANPMVWLEQWADREAGLKFRFTPREDPDISDVMSVGFANGGPRLLIEAIVPEATSTYWEPYWEVTGDPYGRASESRIWSVTYLCIPGQSFSRWSPDRTLGEIAADLAKMLQALSEFVERAAPEQAMPGWIDHFRSARSALEREPEWRSIDPGPAGFLSSEALCLLRAAEAGWVFGGMGSWNDGAYWGSAEAEGNRLSEALFALLNEAVTAVANSSFGKQ